MIIIPDNKKKDPILFSLSGKVELRDFDFICHEIEDGVINDYKEDIFYLILTMLFLKSYEKPIY